jgi:hypothetical protein
MWDNHSQNIIDTFQLKVNQAFDFCQAKYPKKGKIFVNRELS